MELAAVTSRTIRALLVRSTHKKAVNQVHFVRRALLIVALEAVLAMLIDGDGCAGSLTAYVPRLV